jgi:hypothetical protein
MQELEDTHFVQNYYIRVFPADIAEVTVKVNLDEEFPMVDNHIIIAGKDLSCIYDLIRPLRAK